MIKLEDLDQSHDWEAKNDRPDPHSSGYQCRKCWISLCVYCSSQQNSDYEEATSPCPGESEGSDDESESEDKLTKRDLDALVLVGQMYLNALDADPENELLSLAEALMVTEVREAVEKAKRILETDD